MLFDGFLSHEFLHGHHGRSGKCIAKGAAEGPVGFARRTFSVPILRIAR